MNSEDGLLRLRTARRPRTGRSADFWGRLRPHEDSRSGDALAPLGPYETRYDVSRGYPTHPVIADKQ